MNRIMGGWQRDALALFVLLASGWTEAVAGFVQWRVEDGGNSHFYGFVLDPDEISWHQAKDAAAGSFFLWSRGHLVTTTSAAEDDFLRLTFQDLIGDPVVGTPAGTYAWIGLTDEVQEGRYEWVTGELFGYSNWAPGEPNNHPPDPPGEDYTHYWRRDFGSGPLWSWNDATNDPRLRDPILIGYRAYLVEFDGPFTHAVPEPSSLALSVFGALAMLSYVRRHHRARSKRTPHQSAL
jgi:hypothetical protein